MIKIRSIRVLDGDYNMLVIKYPDDLRFTDADLIEKFRSNEKEKWSNVFDKDVTIDIDLVEIPKEVSVNRICELTAREFGITKKALFGKSKQKDLVEAKMFAVNVMMDSGIPVAHIEEQTPFKNRIYYYYTNKLNELRDTEPLTDAKYKMVFDNVMQKINSHENTI